MNIKTIAVRFVNTTTLIIFNVIIIWGTFIVLEPPQNNLTLLVLIIALHLIFGVGIGNNFFKYKISYLIGLILPFITALIWVFEIFWYDYRDVTLARFFIKILPVLFILQCIGILLSRIKLHQTKPINQA